MKNLGYLLSLLLFVTLSQVSVASSAASASPHSTAVTAVSDTSDDASDADSSYSNAPMNGGAQTSVHQWSFDSDDGFPGWMKGLFGLLGLSSGLVLVLLFASFLIPIVLIVLLVLWLVKRDKNITVMSATGKMSSELLEMQKDKAIRMLAIGVGIGIFCLCIDFKLGAGAGFLVACIGAGDYYIMKRKIERIRNEEMKDDHE